VHNKALLSSIEVLVVSYISRAHYSALFGLLAVASCLEADTINGRVVDERNNPIPLARVQLESNTSVSTLSDREGRFHLAELPTGSVRLTITAPGFSSGLLESVDLSNGSERTVEFVLVRSGSLANRERVVVTGSGFQTLLVQAPVRTELISRDAITRQAARTLSESLIANVPSLRIENNCQNCGFSAIRLNGLEGPYTQVLEDGLPTVSGASLVYGLDQLPTQFFENIEVVKGGASALYGPNAVAGVVNLIRREPNQNFFQVDAQQGWNLGRPETSQGAVAQIGNLGGGWSGDFYYRGTRRSHLDLDRDGFTELTRLRSQAGGGTLYRRFFEDRARLTVGGSTLEEFRRGGSQLNLASENTFITEQLNSGRSAGFLRWNHSLNPNFYYNLSTSLSYLGRGSYYGADFDPNAYGTTRNPLSVSDASFGLQRGRHAIASGVQYWFEHITDSYPGYGRNIRQSFRNSGFYLQDEWRLNSRVTLLAGGRVDKSNLLNNAVFSPRGNVRIGLTKSLSLRVGASTGFRAPQVFDEDLHIASVGGEVKLIQRARNLRHESSRSFTSSLDYSSRLRGRPLQFGVNFFSTRLNDVFVLAETNQVSGDNRLFERTNGSGARFRGVEVSGNVSPLRRVSLRGGWTFQQARFDEPEPVFGSWRYFRTPNRYGFTGADIELPGKIDWNNTLDFTGPMLVQHLAGFIAEDRVATSPWFAVWNSVVSRTFALSGNDRQTLKAYLRLNNIGNSYQRDFDQGPLRDASYIYGPTLPRGAVMGLTLSF